MGRGRLDILPMGRYSLSTRSKSWGGRRQTVSARVKLAHYHNRLFRSNPLLLRRYLHRQARRYFAGSETMGTGALDFSDFGWLTLRLIQR